MPKQRTKLNPIANISGTNEYIIDREREMIEGLKQEITRYKQRGCTIKYNINGHTTEGKRPSGRLDVKMTIRGPCDGLKEALETIGYRFL